MGNLTGVAGGGSLNEQLKQAGGSTTTNTEPAAGTPLLSPISITANTNTGGVLRKGANAALANFQCGAVTGSGLFAAKVQHSNDDGATDAYADLSASTQNITGAKVATGSVIGGANPNIDTPLFTDLRGAKAWIRYVVTLISGTSAILGGSVILGAYDTLPPTDY